jgi:ribosomal protein L11 methyltransferase
MDGSYIQIEMFPPDAETGDILLARLQEALEVQGFELIGNAIVMYIDQDHFDEKIFKKILSINNIKYNKSIIYNKNWNEEWEASFSPVVIEDFVAVRAGFHQKQPGVRYDIAITPKMSFGTGHHATTYMMLESLRQFDPAGKSVIDFGTGTGVLAILAAKMGAAKIMAIDNDDWCIENAAENIAANNCSVIQLQKADQFPSTGVWDIILANINLNVILDNFQALASSMNRHSILIISGILKEDIEKLTVAAQSCKLVPEISAEKNNWLCVAFKKMNIL